MKHFISVIFIGALFVTNSFAQENYKDLHTNNDYTFAGRNSVISGLDNSRGRSSAKNIILLIGDGMGTSQIYSALIANGGQLNITQMPVSGFSKTYSFDQLITDSGAGGTALSSGVKTNNGAIGVDEKGEPVTSILEYAEQYKKATGLVATSAITHATPASFIAHAVSRSSYEDIAADFLKVDIDLFIGGGEKHFDSRADGRNLLDSLRAKGYDVAFDLLALNELKKSKIAVLTAPEHNGKYSERGDYLEKATAFAISHLNKQRGGFFLMVEGSQIDWGCHQNDTDYAVGETLDFDKAVGEALRFAVVDKNTLVIVTADHETGGMAITGGDMSKGYVQAQFATGNHSAVMVPVFAYGPGSQYFTGVFENTDVFVKMMKVFGFSTNNRK